jgi:hypothetical protein
MLIFGRTIGLRANPFGLWLLTQLAYPNWVYAEEKDAIFGPNLKLPSVGAGFAAAPLTRIHHFTSLALEQLANVSLLSQRRRRASEKLTASSR